MAYNEEERGLPVPAGHPSEDVELFTLFFQERKNAMMEPSDDILKNRRWVPLVTYINGLREVLGEAELANTLYGTQRFRTTDEQSQNALIQMMQTCTLEKNDYHLKAYLAAVSHPEEVRIEKHVE